MIDASDLKGFACGDALVIAGKRENRLFVKTSALHDTDGDLVYETYTHAESGMLLLVFND